MTVSSTYQWFKSSCSGGSGTQCVECAWGSAEALVRDSKCPDGPALRLRAQAWGAFIGSLEHGVLGDS